MSEDLKNETIDESPETGRQDSDVVEAQVAETRQKAIRNEMCLILRGRYDSQDDVLVAYGDNITQFKKGVSDGAWRVGLLGISAKSRRYVSVSDPKRFTQRVWEALGDMGRAVFLTEAPELTACLVHSVLFRPGLVTFIMEDNTPLVKVYTGRGILSFLAKNHYLKKLEKLMDGSLLRDRQVTENKTKG